MGFLDTPKSVITGTDSNGQEMTFFEWDFTTYAENHIARMIVMFLTYVFIGSIFAPLLTLALLYRFDGRFTFTYLFAIACSGLFLYEVSTGGFMLSALSCFCDDWVIRVLAGLNMAALVVCAILVIFGRLIGEFIKAPMGDYTAADVNILDSDERADIARSGLLRYLSFIVIIVLIAMFSYMVETDLYKGDDWVSQKLGIVHNTNK